ncbi:hypothetical protein OLM99_16925 [Pseudomonas aeruginosa]|uniref:hypothetical protein n=1 Tax=Pseudomonas aeruginosa TaxID=287 RepID=UPI001CC21F1B|nr:hypothetical protein [Pseudomonas aeruginosa]MDI2302996.1 hypothetical protein [Pseudomonas aeruginosa]
MSKELNKAPVEQAGGDERVKCAVCVDSGKVYDISGEGPWKCYACTGSHEVIGYANGDELDNMLDDRTAVLSPVKTSFHTVPVYREARAALAQPSPVQELDFSKPLETENGDPVKWICADVIEYKSARICVAQDTGLVYSSPYIGLKIRNVIPEQAEAERQEVVDFNPYRYHAEKIRQRADGAASAYEAGRSALGYMEDIAESALIVRNGLDELSAQHERIVGELRAKLQAAEDRADTLEHRMMGMMTRHFAEAWRNRDTQKALDGYLSAGIAQLEQERDAALAEVERLRQFERICEGLPQDAIDGGWTVQGIRCYAKRLEDQLKSALARVAELEKQEPVATVAKVPGEDWNGLHFYRDLQGIPSGTKLYTAPVAQAQHSVPELDQLYSMLGAESQVDAAKKIAELIGCRMSRSALTEAQMRRIYENSTEIENERLGFAAFARLMRRAEAVHQIAAAPGKEVPQAWLDVQAERRRQITAEGWTPEHDDEHDSGELAAAGAAYALHAADHLNPYSQGDGGDEAPSCWPWHDGIAGRGEGPEKTEPAWWKPSTPRRDLVKACALALAEIERLDRAAHGKEGV